ncbi:hypothetical protein AB0P12_04360 [Streptomyces subrutilus]|uniref:hypothetical protein n=1 Tax=Streptomyces subrutilus TaxID=36818 RepID=UPI0034136F06
MTTRATRPLVPIDQMPRVIALPPAPHSGDEVLARRPGSGLADGLARPGGILVVERTVGAFHRTGLDERLRGRGVDTVVLAGPVATTGRAEHCPGTRRTGGPSDGPRTAGPTGHQTSGPPNGPMPP